MSLPALAARNLPQILIEEARTLKRLGKRVFLMDVLSPGGDCQNCNAGWVQILIYENENECHPITGLPERPQVRAYRCSVCGTTNELLPVSGLFPAEYDWKLSHIRNLPGKLDAYRFAADALAHLPALSGLALISGPYGVGKTGLGRAGVATVCRYGLPARVVTAEQIWNEVVAAVASDEDAQAGFGTDDKTKAGILARYAHYRLLVVDEVGSTGGGDKQDAFLRQLYDQRYNQRDTHATWFITNQNLKQLATQMPYLASRLETGVQVVMGGKSLRTK